MIGIQTCADKHTQYRPIVQYQGGKWRMAPWIISHFPPHAIYVEPYGGGASVMLRKGMSKHDVYNDLDGDMVNLFTVLRDPNLAQQLARALHFTPFSRTEFESAYSGSSDPVERARRLLIRSHMGFGSNGIHQKTGFRGTGIRTSAPPQHNWADMPTVVDIVHQRFRGVVVENRNALDLIRAQDSDETLFYVDPPYPAYTRGPGHYYAFEMSDDDHRELAAVLRGVRGMVVISGYPCDLYDNELYAKWQRKSKYARAGSSGKRTEVLWLNDAVTSALANDLFKAMVSS